MLSSHRSILAKGEGKKQTLHFMDMNPYHMQLLLQYMYRGEISVPQAELGPLMASARSLQIKGLTNTPTLPSVPNPVPGEDRLSEFANYLASQQQQPLLPPLMPPGDLQPLDASGLINLEPPQQPVMAPSVKPLTAKKRKSPAKANGEAAASTPKAKKQRKSKKPFEELRRESNGEAAPAAPDSSLNHLKHFGEVNDDDLDGNSNSDGLGVGGVTENWSDQQTMKVKVLFYLCLFSS